MWYRRRRWWRRLLRWVRWGKIGTYSERPVKERTLRISRFQKALPQSSSDCFNRLWETTAEKLVISEKVKTSLGSNEKIQLLNALRWGTWIEANPSQWGELGGIAYGEDDQVWWRGRRFSWSSQNPLSENELCSSNDHLSTRKLGQNDSQLAKDTQSYSTIEAAQWAAPSCKCLNACNIL